MLGTFCAICCVQERFGLDFGWIWTPQTYVLEAQTPYFSMVFVDNALIAAGNPGLHFLWLFVLPLQRGGVRSTWNWSQVGHLGPQKIIMGAHLSLLKLDVL